MKLKHITPIVIVLAIFILAYFTNQQANSSYTLHSTTGCCTIHVDIQESPDWGTIYMITYYDNIKGTQHTERETREVDAKWMINTFQDYCYNNHTNKGKQ